MRSRSGQGEGKWDSGARAFFPDSLDGRPERLPKRRYLATLSLAASVT